MDARHSYPHMQLEDRGHRTPLEQTLAVLLPAPLACCRFDLNQRNMILPSELRSADHCRGDSKLVRSLNVR
jgi:hypothetical protein